MGAHSRLRFVVGVGAVLLLAPASSPAQTYTLTCPGQALFPSPGNFQGMGGCIPGVHGYVWPEGLCNCTAEASLFSVTCVGGSSGSTPDPDGFGYGCGFVCTAEPNQESECYAYMEQSGSCPVRAGAGASPPLPDVDVGNPISAITGEMYFTHADARVGELSVSRTYNSMRLTPSTRYGAFGPGWNANPEVRLVFFSSRVIEARLPDGVPLYYTDKEGNGVFEQEFPWGRDSWIMATSSGYERVFRSGAREVFDTSGAVLSAIDASGVETTYSRDTEGRLVEYSRHGRAITFTYDGTETRPASVLGPGGVLLASYTYSYTGVLEAVDYPDGTGYRYGYDNNGRIVWVRDAAGVPLEFHEYDAQGRAVTSELGDGVQKFTLSYGTDQTTVTDAEGNQTVYEFARAGDGMKRITKITGPCASCGGGGGDSQEWTYGDRGEILSYTDAAGETWLYEYDEYGNALTETDPLDGVTAFTFDGEGRPLTRTGPEGSLTTYTYVDAGPATITEKVTATENRTTTLTYTAEGRVETVQDPRAKTTTFSYDPSGDLESVTDPLSHTTLFGYDAFGRRVSVTDPLGNTTETTYDIRSRVTRITNPDDTSTSFRYDKSGRRASVTDPMDQTTRYTYDDWGRLEAVIDPVGGTTRYAYDLRSNLVSLTDAKAQTTTFEYDSFNRVDKVIYPDSQEETFTYYPVGRLQTRTDRNGTTTTYVYDELGRLTDKTYSDGTPAVAYTYDAEGRLLTASNGSDSLTWTYDLSGQLLSEASAANASLVEYTYDNAGNRLTLSLDGTLFVSYVYDDAGRLDEIHRGTDIFGFDYDAASRRTSMTYPNGVVTSYGYDDLSRLTSLDAALGVTPITSFAYTYDDAGNRKTKTTLDHAESYSYDELYRLIGVDRSGTGAETWRYGYDAVGNRETYQIGESQVMTSAYNVRNQLLTRDAGGRLQVSGSLNEPGTVTVDGNPAEMRAGNTFEATIDAAPGVNTFTVQATDASGNVESKDYELTVSGTGASYQYDPNGNLIQKTENGETWEYEWNAENQLTRVLKDSVEVASYKYDPLGRRIEKTTLSGTTAWSYDGRGMLKETSPTATSIHVQGPDVDEPLVKETGSGAQTYYHADGLGSIVGTTDAAGNLQASHSYTAFGTPEAGAAGFAFTGREWDPETELYYYRARYYDPSQGRFLSEDPLGTETVGHVYQYVFNNPTNMIDPLGLKGFKWSGQCAPEPKLDLMQRFIRFLSWAPLKPSQEEVEEGFLNKPGRHPCPGSSLFEAVFPCNLAYDLPVGGGSGPNAAKFDNWKAEFTAQCEEQEGKVVFKSIPGLGSAQTAEAAWCCKCEEGEEE